jgi:chorismate mutase
MDAGTTAVVEAIDTQITAATERRLSVVQEIEVRRLTLREIDAEITRLNRARREVSGEAGRSKREKKVLVSSVVAGPKALGMTEKLMQRVGTITQAEVTKRTGLNSGSISHALKALESAGKVKRTGKIVGRSPEWEFTGEKSTRVRPGS